MSTVQEIENIFRVSTQLYTVETQVEVWEKEKLKWEHKPARQVFPRYFKFFHKTLRSFSKHDGNLNGDVRRNKRIVHTKQRERIISSPNGLINNILVL